jgi:hypothetical protein
MLAAVVTDYQLCYAVLRDRFLSRNDLFSHSLLSIVQRGMSSSHSITKDRTAVHTQARAREWGVIGVAHIEDLSLCYILYLHTHTLINIMNIITERTPE